MRHDREHPLTSSAIAKSAAADGTPATEKALASGGGRAGGLAVCEVAETDPGPRSPTFLSRTIAKERMDAWVARLIEAAEVVAPTAGHGGDELYASISAPDEVLWDFVNPLQPPKQFLLPQTDPIVEITRRDGHFDVVSVDDRRQPILLGVRSCDATAMAFLRHMHQRDLPDPAYLRRADRTVLITMACTRPCSLGFCVCCDAGPFLHEGFDVQLTDLGDRYLAEPGSERGEALLATAGAIFRPALESEIAHRCELEEEAKTRFGAETCHFGSAMRRVSTGRVSEALWSEMSEECFECGACNFVCPTCYCFSVKDRAHGGAWQRCRTWDSCQYAAFTLEASGHNPREKRADRMKRRFFHKVSAQYYQRDGAVGCVGCGRCVKVCLGTTDMPAVVGAIRKGVWHG